MKFHYHKSAKRRGIEGFVMCTLFSVMFGSAWFYLLFLQEKEAGIIFGHVIGWFSIILMPILYFWSFRLINNPSQWDIKITDSEVIWNAPEKIGETSFRIKINEIVKFVCESSKFTDGTDSHYLVLVDGKEIKLKPTQSGVNIDLFIQKLKDLGVDIEVK
ncbi:MAG: hypothetical protein COA63_008265 [Methylophaga sp.]|nr:hypothetical protein [Methylophaga sp.]